ncbi:chromosome transmission fidelity protein 8 [Exophiala viscosa]|uniref:Chromosome transmission fidelity protein 8 n=1 Tax=Exophiala viscosa TaxID=2486360 RepID=A0AAN6DXH7_9EURO|nr:chromosome transmission fidelity protein 8 [Exophiala viscosa]KAI1626397.1 chromosome transmission fidelity protein 8 [Exophiala viscosa]
MPSIQLLPPSSTRSKTSGRDANPLPTLLQTPSGLAILEIQGTIHGALQDPNEQAEVTTSVGRLEFPLHKTQEADEGKWMKKVYLYVGKYQRLTGEVKKLAKPLAVIRKAEQHDGHNNNEDLEIVDIVKFRLLFSGRPEPVGE